MNMVQLISMAEDEFQIYLKHSIANYAQEHVLAGNWDSSDALQRSEKEFLQLLPDGVASKGQHLLSIVDGQTDVKIGLIWFAEKHQASRPYQLIPNGRL